MLGVQFFGASAAVAPAGEHSGILGITGVASPMILALTLLGMAIAVGMVAWKARRRSEG